MITTFPKMNKNQRFKTTPKNGTRYGKHKREILRNDIQMRLNNCYLFCLG